MKTFRAQSLRTRCARSPRTLRARNVNFDAVRAHCATATCDWRESGPLVSGGGSCGRRSNTFFGTTNWARWGYVGSADISNASCPPTKIFRRFLLVTGLRSISIAHITRHGCAKMPCIGITTRGQKGTIQGVLYFENPGGDDRFAVTTALLSKGIQGLQNPGGDDRLCCFSFGGDHRLAYHQAVTTALHTIGR